METRQVPRTISVARVLILCLFCSVLSYIAASIGSVPTAPATTSTTETRTAATPEVISPAYEFTPEVTPVRWIVARILEPNRIQLENGTEVPC
jgi:hypothetical protein